METENPKPQTGGLKLMTVFIVVLALHVIVIGGMCAYNLLKHRSGDMTGTEPAKDATSDTADTTKTDGSTETTTADGSTQPATPPDNAVTDGGTTTPADPNTAARVTQPTNSNTQPITPVNPANNTVTPPVTGRDIKPSTPSDAPVTTAEVTVKAGDSLYKIAKQNHATVDSIKKLNGLTSDNLKIGQKLKIASKSAPTTAPVTALTPATATDKKVVKATTPKATAPVASGSTVYTVNKGDTLTKIAKQFKTTPSAIMSANNMNDPRKLSIGAKLKIPVQQAAVTPAEPAPSKAASAKPAPAPSSDMVMADHPAIH